MDHRNGVVEPLAGAAAFTDVFHEHYGACLRIARRLVRDEGLAHDVVQDVFLAWWRTGGGGYRPERGELAPWLSTLTHHKSVDALRTADRQRRLLAAVQSTRACQPAVPLVDDVVWWELGKQSLSEALLTLPPKQREVLDLAYDAGLTQAAIADRLGIPIGTVKSRTHAGLLRLRASMSETWSPTGPTTGPAPDEVSSPRLVSRLPGTTPAAPAHSRLREDVEACATALIRIAAEETDLAQGAAAMTSRAAELVDEHGDVAIRALLVSLARSAVPAAAASQTGTSAPRDAGRVRRAD